MYYTSAPPRTTYTKARQRITCMPTTAAAGTLRVPATNDGCLCYYHDYCAACTAPVTVSAALTSLSVYMACISI